MVSSSNLQFWFRSREPDVLYYTLVFYFHLCLNDVCVMMNHEEINEKCWRVVSTQKINRWSAKFSTCPSWTCHPHLKPMLIMLAPYEFFDKKIGSKMFLSLQGMHLLRKHIILEASLCLFPWINPHFCFHYKASLFVKKLPKGLHFPLFYPH